MRVVVKCDLNEQIKGYVLVSRLVRLERHRLVFQYYEPKGRKPITIRRSEIAYVHPVVAVIWGRMSAGRASTAGRLIPPPRRWPRPARCGRMAGGGCVAFPGRPLLSC